MIQDKSAQNEHNKNYQLTTNNAMEQETEANKQKGKWASKRPIDGTMKDHKSCTQAD